MGNGIVHGEGLAAGFGIAAENPAGKGGGEAAPLKFAVSLASRARGLLGTLPDGDALLLAPCNDVHTLGMRHSLDIAFVDQSGLVLEVHKNVGPRRRLRNRKAVAVLERFSSGDVSWLEPGERLGVVGLQPRDEHAKQATKTKK